MGFQYDGMVTAQVSAGFLGGAGRLLAGVFLGCPGWDLQAFLLESHTEQTVAGFNALSVGFPGHPAAAPPDLALIRM